MPQVRAAMLTNYDQVARFVGLDPTAMLRSAGIDPMLVADPEQPLPLMTAAHLLEESARQSGCAQFGLLMAESRSLASIGPVSLLLMHESSAGDVVESIVRYQHLFGSAIHLALEPVGDALLVTTELHGRPGHRPSLRQGTEFVLGLFCRYVAAVLGRHWSPESVHFTHPAPADLSVHRRVLQCPIDFDSDFNGFVCDREALKARNPAGDAELTIHAERMLKLLRPPADPAPASEKVRRSLRLLLPAGRGTIDQVAANLCLTPRSLQRLLDREDASFGGLLNAVRRELAQRYLGDTSHQIGAVANLTGYHRASSFSRWFCAEFGMSPAAWRSQARRVSKAA